MYICICTHLEQKFTSNVCRSFTRGKYFFKRRCKLYIYIVSSNFVNKFTTYYKVSVCVAIGTKFTKKNVYSYKCHSVSSVRTSVKLIALVFGNISNVAYTVSRKVCVSFVCAKRVLCTASRPCSVERRRFSGKRVPSPSASVKTCFFFLVGEIRNSTFARGGPRIGKEWYWIPSRKHWGNPSTCASCALTTWQWGPIFRVYSSFPCFP